MLLLMLLCRCAEDGPCCDDGRYRKRSKSVSPTPQAATVAGSYDGDADAAVKSDNWRSATVRGLSTTTTESNFQETLRWCPGRGGPAGVGGEGLPRRCGELWRGGTGCDDDMSNDDDSSGDPRTMAGGGRRCCSWGCGCGGSCPMIQSSSNDAARVGSGFPEDDGGGSSSPHLWPLSFSTRLPVQPLRGCCRVPLPRLPPPRWTVGGSGRKRSASEEVEAGGVGCCGCCRNGRVRGPLATVVVVVLPRRNVFCASLRSEGKKSTSIGAAVE